MPRPNAMGRPKPKIEDPMGKLKRLFCYIFKNYGLHCVFVLVCIIISVLANVQGTMFTQSLIDDYIVPLTKTAHPNFGPLAAKILQVAGFYGIGVITTYAYNRIMVNVTQGTLRNLRVQMFEKMETLPIKYFDTNAHGDIMSTYTNDIDTLRQMISQSIPQAINCGITIVSVFVCMVVLSIPLTILTMIMIGITLVVTKKIAGLSGSYFLSQQRDLAKVNGQIEEMMNGQKVVKVFCHEQASLEEFNKMNEELFESANNANTFANILMPINAQLGNISYVFCAMAGGVLALQGFAGFTLGKLVSFLTFNKSFSQPINQISQQINAIVMALAGADRIFKLLDQEPEVDEGYVQLVNVTEQDGQIKESEKQTGLWAWKHYHQDDGTTTYRKLEGDVVFDDVDFGYNDELSLIHI